MTNGRESGLINSLPGQYSKWQWYWDTLDSKSNQSANTSRFLGFPLTSRQFAATWTIIKFSLLSITRKLRRLLYGDVSKSIAVDMIIWVWSVWWIKWSIDWRIYCKSCGVPLKSISFVSSLYLISIIIAFGLIINARSRRNNRLARSSRHLKRVILAVPLTNSN